MSGEHAPDWVEASRMLREAMKQYRDQRQKSSVAKVVDEVIIGRSADLVSFQSIQGLFPHGDRRVLVDFSQCNPLLLLI